MMLLTTVNSYLVTVIQCRVLLYTRKKISN